MILYLPLLFYLSASLISQQAIRNSITKRLSTHHSSKPLIYIHSILAKCNGLIRSIYSVTITSCDITPMQHSHLST